MKKKIFRSLLALVLVVGLCMSLGGITPSVSSQTVSHTMITGTLSDGTSWAVVTPEPLELWNGTIILNLDGNAVRTRITPTVQWLLTEGYAYGGTTREPVGYDFKQAVDNLLEVRQAHINHYGETPLSTIAWGSSRGGFVGRLCMEFYPDIFDAALVMAGGGGGEIAVLNSKLDSQWVLKTLVNPDSPLEIVGFNNNNAESAALRDLVNLADSTPENQARLALAAAVQQFDYWPSGTTEPARDDYDTQYALMRASYVFAQATPVMSGVEKFAGGIVAWNHDVNYTEMLARSGRQDFVVAMYDKAGLGRKGLMEDLRTLAEAPRIYADPAAVAKAEKIMSYTGEIYGPVMNLDNLEQVDSQYMKAAYQHTVRRAGNNKLLQIAWVNSAGHGNFSDLERITAFVALINHLDTGKWGDTSARGMNELASRILSETDLLSGSATNARFIERNVAPRLLRPWDVSNWDSYQW